MPPRFSVGLEYWESLCLSVATEFLQQGFGKDRRETPLFNDMWSDGERDGCGRMSFAFKIVNGSSRLPMALGVWLKTSGWPREGIVLIGQARSEERSAAEFSVRLTGKPESPRVELPDSLDLLLADLMRNGEAADLPRQ